MCYQKDFDNYNMIVRVYKAYYDRIGKKFKYTVVTTCNNIFSPTSLFTAWLEARGITDKSIFIVKYLQSVLNE